MTNKFDFHTYHSNATQAPFDVSCVPNREFPAAGFVRLSEILAPKGPIPIARATLWAWVKEGRFPQPLKIGARVTVWRAEDVHAFMSNPIFVGG